MSPVTDRVLDARGLRFHLRDWGGAGTPFLLLHGLASTCRIWDFVAPLLARTRRVVALDQRGHGESDKPDAPYDFETVVDDARAVAQSLGLGPLIVAGHSWGGNVALQYGVTYPDEVLGLVFVDGGFLDLGSRMSWEEAQRELAPPALAGMSRTDFLERVRNGHLRAAWRDELEASVLANFTIDERQRVTPRLPREYHLRILRAMWEQPTRELFARVTCPVLVLPCDPPDDGGRDSRWREARQALVEAAAAGLRQARILWLRESIHDVPLQRPELVARLMAEFALEVSAGA